MLSLCSKAQESMLLEALSQTGTEVLQRTVIVLAVPCLFVKELAHTGESPA